jgi:hypothetical protein
MSQNTNGSNTSARRTGALLVALALLVGVDIGARLGSAPVAAAYAQDSSGLLNPADQRRQMLAELKKINASIAKLHETVNSGLNSGPVDVSVVDFPKNLLASE